MKHAIPVFPSIFHSAFGVFVRPVKKSLTVLLASVVLLSPLSYGQGSDSFPPVTDAMLQDPAPSDWLMWRRTLDSWGYSPLAEVDRDNVDQLRMVWTRGLAAGTGEITPLAYNGVLYVPQVNDRIEAIDALTGDLIWEYERDHPEGLYGYVGGNARNNRNIAIFENLIINTSDDGFVFALDAETGETVWETEVFDYKVNSGTHSSGPIIADGRVISGRSCRAKPTYPGGGPEACFVAAHDALTGVELWRRQLIPKPGEPGYETWGDVPYEERQHVGSWMPASYDPELKLIILGTSVTSPAPKVFLGGVENDHLYHNSTLALEVETGEIRWHYQHLNDHWDLDHPYERLLVDTAVAPDPDEVEWINPNLKAGEVRKVITGIPGKTGIVYTLDRETGEFLWATPTVFQNVISDIDGVTGEVTENPELIFRENEQIVFVCPHLLGGRDWEAGAYSPLTNNMYYGVRNTCADMMATADLKTTNNTELARDIIDGAQAIYSLAARARMTPGETNSGTVRAINAETGRTEWIYEQRAGTVSMVATGGRLVFGGDINGRFRAFDDETGEILWEINLGAQVSGYPITFAVDGKQYVAVNTGRWLSLVNPGSSLAPSEIKPSEGTNLFVFALPQ
jgi:PQQ-dependent dehydrogenase (methanol/ethanol family)